MHVVPFKLQNPPTAVQALPLPVGTGVFVGGLGVEVAGRGVFVGTGVLTTPQL
jgi:hypothetical protein